MSGFYGTEPQGNSPMSGRGFGRCRMAPVPAATAQPAHDENGPAMTQASEQNIPVYGCGRGGIACGCGWGFGFGGSRRFWG